MGKKELITPFLIAALGLLFAAICFIVFVSGGKSKRWVAHKMKIGGILLSLSSISTGNGCVNCYDMPAPLVITINGYEDYCIDVDLKTENTVTGILYMPNTKDFSFEITDVENTKIQLGLLVPDDGEFGQETEAFTLEIDNTIPQGDYNLKVFNCAISEQDSNPPFEQFYLKIKNE